MAIKTLTNNDLSWVNIDQVNEETLDFLKREYHFHPLDIEDVGSEQQTPKIDIYKEYLFIVLQLPYLREDSKSVSGHEVDIFVGRNFVVTIQSTKSKDVKNAFAKWFADPEIKKEWMSRDSGYLLYSIMEALFEQSRPLLSSIGKKIYALEQEVFTGDPHSWMIRKLAFERINVLNFRRVLDLERQIIPLIHSQKSFFSGELYIYFDDINDYVNNMWTIINTYKDTIDGLHVTVESLINRKTNKIIATLTMISVALLPLNLLASIYGMNIHGLPFVDNPVWVWALFGVLSAIVAIFAILMRREKWL